MRVMVRVRLRRHFLDHNNPKHISHLERCRFPTVLTRNVNTLFRFADADLFSQGMCANTVGVYLLLGSNAIKNLHFARGNFPL